MTLGQSQWVGDDKLNPLDARLASAALWETNSTDPLDVRTGIVWSGNPTLLLATADTAPATVTVVPLHYVASKGNNNGPYLGSNNANTKVNLPAAPALGSKRIDLVWVKQQDKDAIVSADAVTLPIFGVTSGSPSSSPTKPALPAGCVEVGTVLWDSTSSVPVASNASSPGASATLAGTSTWAALRQPQPPTLDCGVVGPQSVPAATVTAVQWASASLNTAGFTKSSSFQWTVTRAGLYSLTAAVSVGNSQATRAYLDLYTSAGRMAARNPFTSDNRGSVSVAGVRLAVGDIVKLEVYCGTATTIGDGWLTATRLGA